MVWLGVAVLPLLGRLGWASRTLWFRAVPTLLFLSWAAWGKRLSFSGLRFPHL